MKCFLAHLQGSFSHQRLSNDLTFLSILRLDLSGLNVLIHQLTPSPGATGETFSITGRKLDGSDQAMFTAGWNGNGDPALALGGRFAAFGTRPPPFGVTEYNQAVAISSY
jgi:hypothetical protein